MSEAAVLAAMVEVEQAFLDALVDTGLAPGTARQDLSDLVGRDDVPALAQAAEAGGNPVIPLVTLLRERVNHADTSRWLHRGLTSQDVLDTALVLCARDAGAATRTSLRAVIEELADLAERHRGTAMVARTLTQHAVPTTFGVKVAGWLGALLDSYGALSALTYPLQLGGAAGTLSALVELGDREAALACREAVAARLGLELVNPWHTSRGTLTRIGDAATGCTDALAVIANDVLTLSRPEIGELAEAAPGGSSTMPHKQNPVLSALVRRTALAAPGLAATLHRSGAEQVDERAAGAWHVEWATLTVLLRRTVVAAAQAVELVQGLRVDRRRMAATLAAADGVRAEQRAMAELVGRPPGETYTGLADEIIDDVVARVQTALEKEPS